MGRIGQVPFHRGPQIVGQLADVEADLAHGLEAERGQLLGRLLGVQLQRAVVIGQVVAARDLAKGPHPAAI